MSSIKDQCLGIIKSPWRQWGLRDAYLARRLKSLRSAWTAQRSESTPLEPSHKLIIIPSDPIRLTASVGHQAMLSSIVAYWSIREPKIQIYCLTAHASASDAARKLGLSPILTHPQKDAKAFVAELREHYTKHGFKIAVLMGADDLDGSGDPHFSAQQLITADLAARSGARTFITGFSVSSALHPDVAAIFAELDPEVKINLRDPSSQERFTSGVPSETELVADIAFLLRGARSDRVRPVVDWVERQKSNRRPIVGVNVHPLLLEFNERHKLTQLVDNFASILTKVARNKNLSLLLISHDYQATTSDRHALSPLYKKLVAALGNTVYYPQPELQAPVKYLIAPRRSHQRKDAAHDRILGSKTPAFGIDYREKMAGLFDLIDAPKENLTNAAEILERPNQVVVSINRFIDENREIGITLREAGQLTKLAEGNFARHPMPEPRTPQTPAKRQPSEV